MPSLTGSAGRKSAAATSSQRAPNRWPLQDAKARFSELVRKAQDEGPQRVTVHGRDSVVVSSEADYARLTGARSGQLLVDLLAAAPLIDVEFEHAPVNGPVRDVKL
jgi:prevent-host-death family protein